ncbi:MAG: hypothetical protein ABEJ77_05160 [Halanaeroarchaeum sp.]
MSQTTPTYEVYVDATGLPLDVSSPIATADVQYYDSGVWIDRADDRLFFPYRQVEYIREVPAGASAESTETAPDEGTDEPPSDPVE